MLCWLNAFESFAFLGEILGLLGDIIPLISAIFEIAMDCKESLTHKTLHKALTPASPKFSFDKIRCFKLDRVKIGLSIPIPIELKQFSLKSRVSILQEVLQSTATFRKILQPSLPKRMRFQKCNCVQKTVPIRHSLKINCDPFSASRSCINRDIAMSLFSPIPFNLAVQSTIEL